jgi:hypothetical protein
MHDELAQISIQLYPCGRIVDKIIQNAVLFDPFNRQTASQESLLELLSVLPGHIVLLEDREALCSEFFDYQALDSGFMSVVIFLTILKRVSQKLLL